MSPEELARALEELEHKHKPEPGTESTHYTRDLFGAELAQELARCLECGAVYALPPRARGLFDEEHE